VGLSGLAARAGRSGVAPPAALAMGGTLEARLEAVERRLGAVDG